MFGPTIISGNSGGGGDPALAGRVTAAEDAIEAQGDRADAIENSDIVARAKIERVFYTYYVQGSITDVTAGDIVFSNGATSITITLEDGDTADDVVAEIAAKLGAGFPDSTDKLVHEVTGNLDDGFDGTIASTKYLYLDPEASNDATAKAIWLTAVEPLAAAVSNVIFEIGEKSLARRTIVAGAAVDPLTTLASDFFTHDTLLTVSTTDADENAAAETFRFWDWSEGFPEGPEFVISIEFGLVDDIIANVAAAFAYHPDAVMQAVGLDVVEGHLAFSSAIGGTITISGTAAAGLGFDTGVQGPTSESLTVLQRLERAEAALASIQDLLARAVIPAGPALCICGPYEDIDFTNGGANDGSLSFTIAAAEGTPLDVEITYGDVAAVAANAAVVSEFEFMIVMNSKLFDADGRWVVGRGSDRTQGYETKRLLIETVKKGIAQYIEISDVVSTNLGGKTGGIRNHASNGTPAVDVAGAISTFDYDLTPIKIVLAK